ncbi:MAG: patatin-like phospholipase family protein [Candidatus Obscuribacterales bacterium]
MSQEPVVRVGARGEVASLDGRFCVHPDAPWRLERRDGEQPRVALVLGGGGSRGAAHVGVLRVLEEQGMKPDLVVGTSMGAVIGALYCAGVPLDEIERTIVSGEMKRAFMPHPISVQVARNALKRLFFWRHPFPGVFSGAEVERLVDDLVGEDHQEIESLVIPFACVAVNILDGSAYCLARGDVGRCVRASSALPPLLKPVSIGDALYVDGGIRANIPAYAARQCGADVVVAVNVDEKVRHIEPGVVKTYSGLANRISSIIVALRDARHEEDADIVIQPELSGISILSFSSADAERAIREGEDAARARLYDLKAAFNGGEESNQIEVGFYHSAPATR